MKRRLLLLLALLCAVAQGAWAQADWSEVYTLTQTTSADWTALNTGSTTGQTLGSAGNTTYYYVNSDLTFTNSNAGGSGLTIQGTVYLYIPSGVTVTCTGHNASGTTGAGAGVELAAGNTLCLIGGGTLNATGGNAANGGTGASGGAATLDYDNDILYSGTGGTGGYGGGGAGAGIGTRGGNGGAGGAGGLGHERTGSGSWSTANGNSGSAGNGGATAGAMGSLYMYQALTPTVNANGGGQGSNGTGGPGGRSALWDGTNNWSAPGGGGGGAGGFGGAASSIGTGGPGGGGGGGGAAGAVDYKSSGFYDVTSYGGKGGQNGDGSYAADGAEALTSHLAYQAGWVYSNYEWSSGAANPPSGEVTFGNGGNGGACGSASVCGSAINVELWPTQGAGTEADPYLISSTDDWNDFANSVNHGYTFSGKYVKLTNDISVSIPAGDRVSDSDNKPFSGTFLGNGHTITAALENDDNQGLAPFRCINGATIRDLKVAGTIASNQNHTAGIVGFADGTNLIENCIVTATLDIGSNYAGGIIGHGLGSTTTIQGCVFAGTINGVDGNRENIGGLWGWSNSGTPTLVNSLEAGTYTNIASMHPMGLQGGSGTITNCFYVTPQIGNPTNACTVSGAIQALTDAEIQPVGNPTATYTVSDITVYVNGINHNGIFYYHPDRNVKITGLKWYAIATPMHDEGLDYESISGVTNLTTDNYDLLRYDETTGTWKNQKANGGASGFTTLEPGRGYIYRCSDARTLTYTGVPNSEDSYSVNLTATSAAGDLKGFNLVGNPYPFSVTMYRPFYSLGADGIWQAHASGESLEAGQGALVYATSNETLTFYAATRSTNSGMDALPALPKGLCLGGNGDDPSNHAISQSVNLPFAYLSGNSIVVTGTGTLQAYDIMGRLLFRMELNTEHLTLNTSLFPSAGVYLLRLGDKSQKIVIR